MLDLEQINLLGSGLKRPECVMCTADGRVHASNWDGGVSILEPDGDQSTLLPKVDKVGVKPNGICLLQDGSYLLAHLGPETGGVYRLTTDGGLTPFLLEIDGISLPATNFVHTDFAGRIWISVSTRKMPRNLGYTSNVSDGFIVLVANGGAKIVADGLGYTNECVVHPDGLRLYVNETFSRRLSCFEIASDGSLSNRRTVTEFGAGTFPDGLVFDAEGAAWITSIVSNRVIRVSPTGEQTVVIEDCDPEHVAWVEEAFQGGCMARPHLDQVRSRKLRNISSLAFGGADLRTGYLGCLLGDSIATFRSPVPGLPPSHWNITSTAGS